MRCSLLFFLSLALLGTIVASTLDEMASLHTSRREGHDVDLGKAVREEFDDPDAHVEGIVIAEVHTTDTSVLLMGGIAFILFASFARIFLEMLEFHYLPESAIIIIIGVIFGLFVWAAGDENDELWEFDEEIFFLILIPPIIFDSGYHLDKANFFRNVRLILLYALVGTAITATVVGLLLYAARDLYAFDLPVFQSLTFGSLIAAVDPVAVISVFDEVHVNDLLYILVFGESVLNDGVSIVLYDVFESLDDVEDYTWDIPFLAFAKFLYVAVGGLSMGIAFGLFTALIVRFTGHREIHLIEPLIVVCMGQMAFLVAETVKMSGIFSSMFAGITMSHYVVKNLHPVSRVTTRYVVKIIAGTTETIIFIYLGINSVLHLFKIRDDLTWEEIWGNGAFIGLTLLYILPTRFFLTYSLGWLDNFKRLEKVSLENLFIISYGGLRGAIAFTLAWELPNDWEGKNVMITTVIIAIWFTVFVQGGTIKPLIQLFKVKTKQEHEATITEKIIPRVFNPVQQVVRGIYGYHGRGWFMRTWKWLDKMIMTVLIRDYDPEANIKRALNEFDAKKIEMQNMEEEESEGAIVVPEEDILIFETHPNRITARHKVQMEPSGFEFVPENDNVGRPRVRRSTWRRGSDADIEI